MIKILQYFFQSIIVYIFFIFGRILGLRISRKFFSKLFQILGPKFKSNKIINENLDKYNQNMTSFEKEEIISQMWSNYGKTFIIISYIHKIYFV